eukprot:Clim_evm94s149 gene=Clim_evmTU94s149
MLALRRNVVLLGTVKKGFQLTTARPVVLATRRHFGSSRVVHKDDVNGSNSDSSNGSSVREQILDKSIELLPEYGFTDKLISTAVEELKFSPAAHGIIGNGVVEVAEEIVLRNNELMLQELRADPDFPTKRRDQQIYQALSSRLLLNEPYMAHWQDGMALMIQPQNASRALQMLQDMVDDIWREMGDDSIEMDWYVKRGSTAAVYTISETFMLQDRSEGYRDTLAFLRNRVSGMAAMANLKDQGELLGGAFAANAQGLWTSLMSAMRRRDDRT